MALAIRIFLFAVNLYLRSGNLAAVASSPDGYLQISQNLIFGHGFSAETQAPFLASVLRPPFYPFLIAGVTFLFKNLWAILAIQIAVSSLIPALGYRLAKNIINSEKAALLTGLFLAFEPYGAELSYVFMTETVFIFIFFICLAYLWKYFSGYKLKDVILLSAFLGLAVLTRPVVQYLPIIIGFFIFWHFRKNIKMAFGHIAILAGIFILVISPWLYRNYKMFGVWGLTVQTEYNFYAYLTPSVLSIARNTLYTEEKSKLLNLTHFKDTDITLANSNSFLQTGWGIIKNYPGSMLKSLAITEVTFFSHDDGIAIILSDLGISSNRNRDFPGTAVKTLLKSPVGFLLSLKQMLADGRWSLAFIFAARLFWIAITILSVLGVTRLYKNNNKKLTSQQLFSILLALYFALVSSINGLGINARFRLPIQIFIFAFAAYFIFSPRKIVPQNLENL